MDHYFERQTLIAVAKDEKYLLLLRKFLESDVNLESKETNKQFDVVTWDDKTWLEQKKIGQIKSKVLLIGRIKDSDKLIPLLDVKFDKYGVKYGWSGRQALITADYTALEKSKDFPKFMHEFNNLDIPEQYKIKEPDESTQLKRIRRKIAVTALAGVKGFLYEEIYKIISSSKELTDKLIIFGLVHFYKNHISEFMK